MISVENVSKSFGKVSAVQNVSFKIERGEVVGFLGPNGAGKTTMMRLVTGFFPPTEGKIVIHQQDLRQASLGIRRNIGYLAEHNPLYRDMTARAFLDHVARLKGIPRKLRKPSIDKVVDQCGVGPVFNRIIDKLSKGFKQRIGLAQALLGDPDLLVLDEPTSGLDPKQIIEIRTLIQKLGAERTILLSSHILPEIQMTCERVLIMNEGRLVASGTARRLEEDLRHADEVLVTVRSPRSEEGQVLANVGNTADVLDVKLVRSEGEERDYRILTRGGKEVRSQIAKSILNSGVELLSLKSADWSLEDIFMKIVTRESEELEVCRT